MRFAVFRLFSDHLAVAADRLPRHQFRGLILRQVAGWLPAIVPLPQEDRIPCLLTGLAVRLTYAVAEFGERGLDGNHILRANRGVLRSVILLVRMATPAPQRQVEELGYGIAGFRGR